MKLLSRTAAISLLLLISLGCQSARTQTAAPLAPLSSPGGVWMTYIANEGVLISAGDEQVLIDGLHRSYKPDYAFPPPELQAGLEGAKPPYDAIDLVLVTHLHLDHFHPVSVGEHLANNPKAVLVSSQQIAAEIAKEYPGYEKVRSRIVETTPEWKTSVETERSGIRLQVLGLKHSSARFSWIQNLGYVVDVGGKRFLHVGDADMSVENFAPHGLAERGIDVAFIPYWFLLDETGQRIVTEVIRPKRVVAVHISPNDAGTVREQLGASFPGAIALTSILEKHEF